MDKPYYPHKPISSIDTLAKALGIRPSLMLDISNKTSDSYTEFEIKLKNKKPRTVYEPKHELKRLQKRVNSRIFEAVEYPAYLQGGIRDENNKRDYVRNAEIHKNAQTIVSIDIKKYFDNIRPKYVNDIFKYFFKFPDDVSDLLSKIVTLGNKVPQGACTSTYVANLIFFNTEYKIVSDLRGKGISYSRLLDDVTISSESRLTNEQVTEIIKSIAAMFRKYGLKINNDKTKKEYKKHSSNPNHFKVTGIWVGNKQPRLRKVDRRQIRHQVYICEQEYKKSAFVDTYHKLWNNTSGLVAKLDRLNHKQARNLRSRLNKILPLYDEHASRNLVAQVRKTFNASKKKHNKVGLVKKIGKLNHQLGILGRTDKQLAKSLRQKLNSKYSYLPTYKEIWE